MNYFKLTPLNLSKKNDSIYKSNKDNAFKSPFTL